MTDNNCLFCKIIEGKIPSTKVYEDDKMFVFKDIAPKAKVHLLAVPKEHFVYLADLNEERKNILAHMFEKIPAIAKENGCTKGFRTVINQGTDAGQTVFHLHVHILGGENLPW